MNILSNIITIFVTLVIIYAILAISIAVWSILKGRDQLYREKYQEFLDQKRRVEDRLKRMRDDSE